MVIVNTNVSDVQKVINLIDRYISNAVKSWNETVKECPLFKLRRHIYNGIFNVFHASCFPFDVGPDNDDDDEYDDDGYHDDDRPIFTKMVASKLHFNIPNNRNSSYMY